jgi:tartrate-resistant acid phosphatase type 5
MSTPKRFYRLLALGDVGEEDQILQLEVRDAIAQEHAREKFWRGLLLGDNFYPCGVGSIDDSQFERKIVSVYHGLDIPFHAILGNHDHCGDIAAQVAFTYSKDRNPLVRQDEPDQDRLWTMRGPVYSMRYENDTGPDLEVFALDTEMAGYGGAKQDTVPWHEQLAWLEERISNSPARWRIVLGHHPVQSDHRRKSHLDGGHTRRENMRKLSKILAKHAHLYLSGHDHSLQVLPLEAFTTADAGRTGLQIVSGSGGARGRIKSFSSSKALSRGMPGDSGFIALSISPDYIEVEIVVVRPGQTPARLDPVRLYPDGSVQQGGKQATTTPIFPTAADCFAEP